ncbi:MAG TPA: pacearchaeosortase [Candidatus Paceibacterota bacterium]|nr:pacearchaeosortase [Candidatus Paceibacterota bacterium]
MKRKKGNNFHKENKFIINLTIRYLIILLLGLGNIFLFYFIFTPLTIYPSYLIIKLIYSNAVLEGSNILISNYTLEIVEACVAGAAYYLLFILNFTTDINIWKRLRLLLYSSTILLSFNILRIVLLSVLFVNNNSFFDITHKFFWYFFSVLFVVIVWFSGVYFFKIRNIPIYSDIKDMIKIIKKSKK